MVHEMHLEFESLFNMYESGGMTATSDIDIHLPSTLARKTFVVTRVCCYDNTAQSSSNANHINYKINTTTKFGFMTSIVILSYI